MGGAFHRLWAASAISNLGDGVGKAAFPLLAATLTREPALIGALTFAFGAPLLLFGVASGAIVDRVDRRRVMLVADALRAAALALLAAAVALDAARLWLVFAAAFLVGAAETFFDNAAHAFLPALVRADDLDRANGRLGVTAQVANDFAGPPIGSLAFAAAAATPFAANAAGFAVAVLLLLGVRGRYRVERPGSTTLRADIAEGLAWLARHPLFRTIGAAVALLALADAAWFGILVLYALEILELEASRFGILLAAGAAGGMVGSLAAAPLRRRLGAGAALSGAVALAGATQLVLGLTSDLAVALVMLALSALAFSVWNVVTLSLRQTLVPDRLRGRVSGAYRAVGAGTWALGALVGGFVAQGLGLRAPFLLGAPLLFALAVALYGATARNTITPPT